MPDIKSRESLLVRFTLHCEENPICLSTQMTPHLAGYSATWLLRFQSLIQTSPSSPTVSVDMRTLARTTPVLRSIRASSDRPGGKGWLAGWLVDFSFIFLLT